MPNPPHAPRISALTPVAEAEGSRRIQELSRLLPLWPAELRDQSLAGRRQIVRRLAKALRAERQRGRGGHWAYSLARHAQLAKALRNEHAALSHLEAEALIADKQKGPHTGEPS